MNITERIDAKYLSLIQSALDNALPNSHLLSPKTLRAVRDAQQTTITPPENIIIDDEIVVTAKREINIRIYRQIQQTEQNTPVLIFLHGGGFVVGNLDTHQGSCILLCRDTSWPVISIDYRKAPEHPFPAATNDCYDVLCWVSQQQELLKIDPARIAVVGESAGGNLATVTALMARDRNGPMPAFQLLFYPVTDCNFKNPSYINYGEGPLLSASQMEAYWSYYLGGKTTTDNPYAAPLRANTLKRMPSTAIVTAEFDVLRSEAEAYAVRLKAEGVATQEFRAEGLIHGFMKHVETHPVANRVYIAARNSMTLALKINTEES
ncbi:MAG: alpha/beta hydrolase [Pseudomonadota bacterium]|nr:alpha/beta hydrolase [Pseudomonadota bacterium]